MRRLWFLALAACPSKHDAPPAPVLHAGRDAGVIAEVTTDLPVDEATDYRPPPSSNHASRPIDVTLRSTPPNAEAAVDGVPLGTTPAYWSGVADGREHEFTFALPRHAVARYRFVPITSGVVHARLEPIAEEIDAGVGPEPASVVTPPVITPSAIVPPPPAPADAATGSLFGPRQ